MQWILCLALAITVSVYGQGSAGADASIETRYVIDVPTAGLIAHGNIALDADFFEAGGVMTRVSFGAFDRMLFGLSYGGSHLIGTDVADWNNAPGVLFKIRIVDESTDFPALALGFDSQGKDTYISSLHRYAIKSAGFFAVASKNYQAYGSLCFHGGANYSLERSDGDDNINFFGGVEKTFGPFLSMVGEYNVGLNDSNHDALGKGRGYLNAGLRSSLGSGLTFAFSLKDILQNQGAAERTMSLEYVKTL